MSLLLTASKFSGEIVTIVVGLSGPDTSVSTKDTIFDPNNPMKSVVIVVLARFSLAFRLIQARQVYNSCISVARSTTSILLSLSSISQSVTASLHLMFFDRDKMGYGGSRTQLLNFLSGAPGKRLVSGSKHLVVGTPR